MSNEDCIPCVSYTYTDLESSFWEDFTQATEVTNLFVWSFRGELIYAVVRFPGNWYDYNLAAASGLYRYTLTEKRLSGIEALADRSFQQRYITTGERKEIDICASSDAPNS